MGRKTLPVAVAPWALDSGAFSVISQHGGWEETPEHYAACVQRYADEIGQMEWASPQDWMCEPTILRKTRLTVAEHQRRTVENYLTLRDIAPELPFIPVLQGYTADDYLRCADLYDKHVNLENQPVVGVGTLCRRQATPEIGSILSKLQPLRLHGYGIKLTGLRRYGQLLHSADSLAWSFDARRKWPLDGHTHLNCANCFEFAANWRDDALDAISFNK